VWFVPFVVKNSGCPFWLRPSVFWLLTPVFDRFQISGLSFLFPLSAFAISAFSLATNPFLFWHRNFYNDYFSDLAW